MLVAVLAVQENDSDDAEDGGDPEQRRDRIPRQGGSQERYNDDLETENRDGHRDVPPFQGEKLGDLTPKQTKGDEAGLPEQGGINFWASFKPEQRKQGRAREIGGEGGSP